MRGRVRRSIGVRSRAGIAPCVKSATECCERIGVRHVVLVADLETKMPTLWASMVAVERARATSRYLDSLVVAEREGTRKLGQTLGNIDVPKPIDW